MRELLWIMAKLFDVPSFDSARVISLICFEGDHHGKRAKKAVQTEGAGTTKKPGRPGGKRSGSSFARLVTAERKRLQKLRDKVHARRTQIDRELADIERDLQAMGSFVSGSGQSG